MNSRDAAYGPRVETVANRPAFPYNGCMPTVEFLDAGKKVDCGQYANLRKIAILHGVEVYRPFGKLVNCRGNGLCGECVMEIIEGLDNLSPKTRREQYNIKLRGKPETYRLSCQCQVLGDVACVTAPAMDPVPMAKPVAA